jgi:hypothetical protein
VTAKGQRSYRPEPGRRRGINVNGRMTSLYLSNETWAALERYQKKHEVSRRSVVCRVDRDKGGRSLAQAMRDFLK